MQNVVSENQEIALRCHDISIGLGTKDVAEFELIPEIGLMVRLALHIRGLPRIPYDVFKLVAFHHLQIPMMSVRSLVISLEQIGFIKILSEGEDYKFIIPTVPFYDDLYGIVGQYAKNKRMNEPEQFAITMLSQLTLSPVLKDSLYQLGADKRMVDRSIQVGIEGNYILSKRCRGKNVVVSPVFFSENADIYADLVAKSGAKSVERILHLLKTCQGIPLAVIESQKEIQGSKLTDDEINLLKRLASDGSVKPPAIVTSHSGTNYFMFTPTPGEARLNPTKREIYERAMALISAVRQGQYLPKEFAIKNPYWILRALRDKKYLKANSEAFEQYKQLSFLRVGRLVNENGRHRFELIDSIENIEALEIAIKLLHNNGLDGMEIDENTRITLGKDQKYIESLMGSKDMRERSQVAISEESAEQIELLFLGGV